MKKLAALVVALLVSNSSFAGTEFYNLSLTPDISVQDRGTRIEGVSLSIWGENDQKGLSLGFVNGSVESSSGLSLGILNYADDYRGVQMGILNHVEGDMSGWQSGAANCTTGQVRGLQSGWLNYAGKLSGVQIGLVNYAATVTKGVQVGLLNIMPETTDWFTGLPDSVAPAMVFVNWRF